MVRSLLIRGMLVGFLAGLLIFGFGKIFGEPQVNRAIAFETALDAAKAKANLAKGIHDPPPLDLVSRANQASWGLLTGVVVYATAFGGLFALVFAFAYARASNLDPRAASAVLALLGFVGLYVVPNLKYPANPPAIGSPETIGIRTALYFSMIALSVAAMVGAAILRKRLILLRACDAWRAVMISGLAYLVVVVVAAWFLPPINEVPADFPATVLWRFRIDALAMQAIMWLTLGLGFGMLTERDQLGRLHRLRGAARVAWR